MTDQVTELENELSRLQAEVADCKRRLQEAREEAAGIKVGDLATCKGDTYKVVSVEFHNYLSPLKPWVYGVTKTKNGSWSKNQRCLYADWVKP